ncbi:MAG: UDP-N-acetylmuramoyl-L-alanine--D-glutamate ligase, partial [Myxococcota bacterium]
DVMVLELSSFQLETAYRARFNVAAVLNITPDHGERYARFEDYALAKSRLVENLGPADVAVLNARDPETRALADRTKARVWWFSPGEELPGPNGVVLNGRELRGYGEASPLDGVQLGSVRIPGAHNLENAMAALACSCAAGIDDWTGLVEFPGLPDRLEFVQELNGVAYINDSKATNDEAAATAVLAMDRPVVLLAGGVEKGGGYRKLVDAARGRVRCALCYGEAGAAIATELSSSLDTENLRGFADAFDRAQQLAQSGDVVLLAPACSSFDEFSNYRARGEAFRSAVARLGESQ